MNIKAVLFDLFNTLVLLEDEDAFYMPSLKRLHKFLVKNEEESNCKNGIRIPPPHLLKKNQSML